MIIELCPKGHRYDAAYFSECPHCLKEIKTPIQPSSDSNKQMISSNSTNSKNSDSTRKSGFVQNIRTNTKREPISSRQIEESIQEVTEKVTFEEKENKSKKKAVKKNISKRKPIMLPSNSTNYIFMASAPEKLMKNQEFCVDFCLFRTDCWRDGADMLSFKSHNSCRDIKTVSLSDELSYTVSILYKDELLKKISFTVEEIINRIITYPVIISDSRDRKTHLLKICIENVECDYKETLLLQPTN